MERTRSIAVGVVVERRDVENRWIDHVWRVVAVLPGAPETDMWRETSRGPDWVQYHIGTLPLEIHRKETDAYRSNLAEETPVVFVVLREAEDDDEPPLELFLISASPYEAQDYLDSGEDIVESVPMPKDVMAWLQDFVDIHHVDEPFVKRKRKRNDADPDTPFWSKPPRGRMDDNGGGLG